MFLQAEFVAQEEAELHSLIGKPMPSRNVPLADLMKNWVKWLTLFLHQVPGQHLVIEPSQGGTSLVNGTVTVLSYWACHHSCRWGRSTHPHRYGIQQVLDVRDFESPVAQEDSCHRVEIDLAFDMMLIIQVFATKTPVIITNQDAYTTITGTYILTIIQAGQPLMLANGIYCTAQQEGT